MIYIGSDHAGFRKKEKIRKFLEKEKLNFLDLTPKFKENDDYPDIAKKVGGMVGKQNIGILICKTGIGMCISANKIRGIRAALCRTKNDAELSRKHNNANILCLGTKTMNPARIVKTFLNTDFERGRHLRRIKKIE